MGLAAGDLGGPAYGLDGAALGGAGVVHAGELDDGARRQAVQGRGHVDGGAAPGEAEHVALGDEFAQQVGRHLAEVLRVGRVVAGVGRGLHDHGVAQAVAGPERVGTLRVELGGHPDLDPHEVAFERRLQDARDLEAADAELLGDLDLGLALQVEAAGHGRRLNQLGGSHPRG